MSKVKILWKSSALSHNSFALPKGSPLLPFFNHALSKLRQSGTLLRIKEKWMPKNIPLKCESNPLEPISFYKIISVVVLFLFGIGSATIIFVFEIVFKAKESNFGDHVNLQQEPLKTDTEELFDINFR